MPCCHHNPELIRSRPLRSQGGGNTLIEATCQVLANLCEDNTDDWRRLLQNGAVFSLTNMVGNSSTSLQEAATNSHKDSHLHLQAYEIQ